MKNHILLLFFGLWLLSFGTFSQSNYSISKKINIQEISGLSKLPFVNCIFEDHNGFVWIGTSNGLFKFDGYQLKHYEFNPTRPNKLAGNEIEGLTEDEKGYIWIGIFGSALQRLDPLTDTFLTFKAKLNDPKTLQYSEVISLFYQAPYVWMYTFKNPLRVNVNTFELKTFDVNSGILFKGENEQEIWYCGQNDIYKFDQKKDDFQLIKHHGLSQYIIPQYQYKDNLYFQTETSLYNFNIINKSITKLDSKENFGYQYGLIAVGNKLLCFGNARMSWLDFDLKTIQPIILTNEQKIKLAFNSQAVNFSLNIFKLHNGDIWIAANKLFKLIPDEKGIESFDFLLNNKKIDFYHPASQLSLLPDGRLNIGKAAIIDFKKQKAIPMAIEFPFLKKFDGAINFEGTEASYTQQYVDNKGVNWLVFYERKRWENTLFKLQMPEKRLEEVAKIVNKTEVPMGIAQKNNTIWTLSWGTLDKYDLITKKHTSIKSTGDSTGLCAGALNCLYLDKSGDLWIGTFGGLVRRPKGKNYFIHYLPKTGDKNSLSYESVSCISEDAKGNILIGTTAGGLNVFDKKTNKFRWITENEGLAGNKIQNIQIDNTGKVWVSNGIGLSCWNPATNKVQNFSASDGLYESIAENTSTKLADGSLVFGGNGGFNIIRPEKIKTDNTPNPIFITDIKLFNQSVLTEGSDSTFRKAMQTSKHLEFNYNQNVLTLEFAAVDMDKAEQRNYAYLLEGFDNDWQYVGNKRNVTYTNLPAGQYTFRVKSENQFGIWHEMKQPLYLMVNPPWWKTWWSYLLYLLTIGGGIFGFISYRSAALRRENQLLEGKVTLRTTELQHSLDKLKTTQTQLIQSEKLASLGELTAGIAHEIQNPLNFVNNFSELSVGLAQEINEEIDKDVLDKEYVKELMGDLTENQEKINLHGKRASSIVTGMLQHSQSSSGKRELTDINKLADESLRLSYHGLRAKDKNSATDRFNSDFELITDPNLPKIEVIPQDIGRVLINLINNAFYAVNVSSSSPKVIVSTKKLENAIEIRVTDNGTGMSEATKAKIFQPFFTTKPTGQGTGLGLSLAYDIVTKGHGGTLEVDSKEGEGTTFTIHLPISQ